MLYVKKTNSAFGLQFIKSSILSTNGPSVLYLDLQENNITEITQNVLAVYPNLISIDVRGNQYICGGLKVSGIKVRSNCPTEIMHNIITSETANPISISGVASGPTRRDQKFP